jgi:ABC-type transport system involved in multi-copper enzyme maturation permease subunit
MITALRADWLRLRGRPDIWLAALMVPTLVALGLIAAYFEAITQVGPGPGPRPPDMPLPPEITAGMEYVRRPFTIPQVWLTALGSSGLLTFAVTFLAIATLGAEFSWGTLRTSLLAGTSRTDFVVARLTALALVAVGLLLLTGAVATVIAIALTILDGGLPTVEGPSIVGVVEVYGALTLTTCAFASVAVLLTLVTRSMIAATILMAAYVLSESLVLGSAVWSGHPTTWAQALSLVGSTESLLADARLTAGDLTVVAGTATAQLPGWVSLAAVLAWVLLPALIALLRFKRMDVRE